MSKLYASSIITITDNKIEFHCLQCINQKYELNESPRFGIVDNFKTTSYKTMNIFCMECGSDVAKMEEINVLINISKIALKDKAVEQSKQYLDSLGYLIAIDTQKLKYHIANMKASDIKLAPIYLDTFHPESIYVRDLHNNRSYVDKTMYFINTKEFTLENSIYSINVDKSCDLYTSKQARKLFYTTSSIDLLIPINIKVSRARAVK